jgi:general stress protein YciG
MTEKEKKPRGFAAMTPEKQRESASRGGKSAHAQGKAHTFTPDEAREAGAKGGRAVAQDREHMSTIGRKGAKARHAAKKDAPDA